MARPIGVVIESKEKRERFSKAEPFRFQLQFTELQLLSLLYAMQDRLLCGEPHHTWSGLEGDLALYERLFRMIWNDAPLLDTAELQRRYGHGEFRRVIEEAGKRWTV
jgi:hypothetical protein